MKLQDCGSLYTSRHSSRVCDGTITNLIDASGITLNLVYRSPKKPWTYQKVWIWALFPTSTSVDDKCHGANRLRSHLRLHAWIWGLKLLARWNRAAPEAAGSFCYICVPAATKYWNMRNTITRHVHDQFGMRPVRWRHVVLVRFKCSPLIMFVIQRWTLLHEYA